MLAIRPRHVAHTFEDFSIFDSNNEDAFEPLPIDRPRTEQQTAAIRRVFQDSIRLLQHSEITTRIRQDPGFRTQATLSSSPLASTRATCTEKIIEPTNPATDFDSTRHGGYSPFDAIGSAIPRNEAVRPIHHAEDHRIHQQLSHPSDEYSMLRFRPYQTDLWDQRFNDLIKYRQRHGHCCVPNTYAQNPSLARWVKRQRYQYKLRSQGKESTMTNSRLQALEKVGFIWHSHNATWEERVNELKAYCRIHGHCEVPTHYQQNKKLATWVKCQRRQYKLYLDGKQSTMTPERIDELDQLNFSWEMRAGPRGLDE